MTGLPQEHVAVEQNEAAFHDARIEAPDGRRWLRYVYASVHDLYGFSDVPSDRLGGSVLELGCFRGNRARHLTGFHGRFLGVDISAAAVAHCVALGLPENFDFRVDNANVLGTVPDGSVDYAFGDGVLHHLDLARAAPCLASKLAPGGYARFIEPAQGNLVLRAFRALTPRLRTPDEHPFDRELIQLLEQHFSVRITHRGLLRPYVPMLFFNNRKVTAAVAWLEERLLRIAFLRSQAWLLLIELRKR